MMDGDLKDVIDSVAVDVSEDPNLHEPYCRFSHLIRQKVNIITLEELENTFYSNELPPCKSKKSKSKDNGFKGYSEKEFKERLAKLKRNASPQLKEKIRKKMESPHIVWYVEESWKTYEEHKATQKKMCKCPRAKVYQNDLIQEVMEVDELSDIKIDKPSGEVQLVATDISSAEVPSSGNVKPSSEVPSDETVKPSGEIQAVETEMDASSADVLTGETVKSTRDFQSDEAVTEISSTVVASSETDMSSSEVPSAVTVDLSGEIQAVETEMDTSSADVLTGETVKSPGDIQSDQTVTDIELSPDGTLMSSAEFGSGETVNPSKKIQIVENEMDTSSVDVLCGETGNLSGEIQQSDEANADVSTEVLFKTTNSSQDPESFDTEKSNEDVQSVVEAIKSTDDHDHASFEEVQKFQVVLSTEGVESVEDAQVTVDTVKRSDTDPPPLPLTSDISVVSTGSPWTGESKKKLSALDKEEAVRYGLDLSESDTDVEDAESEMDVL